MSVPTISRERQRIDQHHDETEERAAPDGREADDEAEDGTDRDGADLVPAQDEPASLG